MGETIVRVDPATGAAVGAVDRDLAHRQGIWHASVHVWLLTEGGAAVLQRRAADKALYPGRWDVSAAGHPRPGEDGLREVAEELGVAVDRHELEDLGRQRVVQRTARQTNREWARVWLWRSPLALEALRFLDGEVSAVAALPPAQLRDLIGGRRGTAPAWDGRRLATATIAPEALVPLPDAYWAHLLAAL